MTGSFPWSDSLIILEARRSRLAKMLLKDGTLLDYDSAYLYDATTEKLDGLDDLWTVLDTLRAEPSRCVVRGELISGSIGKDIRRLVYPDKETGDQPTLRDVPRRWVALDVDGVSRPDNVAAHDLVGCAELVFGLLPSQFGDAAGFIQATAGHGIKPGCRLRLWFWADRPLYGQELKRWLAAHPVDPSVFNPVQPIYTSAPVFAPGTSDPLPYRLAEWPGSGWLKAPPPEELAPPPRKTPEYVRPAHKPGTARADLYVDAALDSAAKAISTASNRHPTILDQACSLARFVKAGLLSERRLQETLWSAAQDAGKDDEDEIIRIVRFAMDNARGSIPQDVLNG